MSNPTDELKFAASHEWAREEDDGTITVGISDHAQEQLGDLVFVELPQLEQTVDAGSECCVVESAKAASDVYSPVSGEIVEVNEGLVESPGAVNSDPYGEGWLFRVKPSNLKELQELLPATEYDDQIAAESH